MMEVFDTTPIFVWFVLLTRFSGLLFSLPGIGTNQIPAVTRFAAASTMAFALVVSGYTTEIPQEITELILYLAIEFIFGYLIGFIPTLLVSGLLVAGQTTSATIGLAQASLIDPSLGGSTAVIGRFQQLFGVGVFLLIDGHHNAIKACSGLLGEVDLNQEAFISTVPALLVDRLSASFDLAMKVSAPALITVLLTQFVLGLITKFVPQVNIFIISLPLTIFVGLFITAYLFQGLSGYFAAEVVDYQEMYGLLLK